MLQNQHNNIWGEQKSENNVSLVDADSIIYISGWDKDNKCYYTDFNLICESADKLISNILLDTKANYYLGFFGRGITFRRQKVNTYKSNRDKLIKPPHFSDLKDYIVNKWGFQYVDNIEADDAVNICKNNIDNSIICTADKDLTLLTGKHYNYKKKEFITTNKEEAELAFWRDMITGQPGDGIGGLKGKGDSFCNRFFKDYSGEYQSDVLMLYIHHYKSEYKGIEEFYNTYIQLKILDEYENFVIPNPIKLNTGLLIL